MSEKFSLHRSVELLQLRGHPFLAATAAQEVHLSLRVFVCSCVVNLSKHSALTVLRLQLHKCSNVAMQKCSNVEMYKCSNVAM